MSISISARQKTGKVLKKVLRKLNKIYTYQLMNYLQNGFLGCFTVMLVTSQDNLVRVSLRRFHGWKLYLYSVFGADLLNNLSFAANDLRVIRTSDGYFHFETS